MCAYALPSHHTHMHTHCRCLLHYEMLFFQFYLFQRKLTHHFTIIFKIAPECQQLYCNLLYQNDLAYFSSGHGNISVLLLVSIINSYLYWIYRAPLTSSSEMTYLSKIYNYFSLTFFPKLNIPSLNWESLFCFSVCLFFPSAHSVPFYSASMRFWAWLQILLVETNECKCQ